MSSGRGCSSCPFVLRDAHYVPPCWPPRAESLVSPRSDLTCRGPVRLCCRWYRPAVNGSTGKTCWFSRQILCFSWGFFCVFFFSRSRKVVFCLLSSSITEVETTLWSKRAKRCRRSKQSSKNKTREREQQQTRTV